MSVQKLVGAWILVRGWNLRRPGVRFLFFICLVAISWSGEAAPSICSDFFAIESDRIKSDLLKRLEQHPGYDTRDLHMYEAVFSGRTRVPQVVNSDGSHPDEIRFANLLRTLRSHQAWVDFGSGQGQALRQAARDSSVEASLWGIDGREFAADTDDRGRKSTRVPRFLNSVLIGLDGNGDHGVSHYLKSQIKEAVALVTDFYGPAVYAPRLDRVVQTALDLMSVGGVYFFKIQTESVLGQGSGALGYEATSIKGESLEAQRKIQEVLKRPGLEKLVSHKQTSFNRKEEKIEDLAAVIAWLESIRGVKIVAISNVEAANGLMVALQKVEENALVPRLWIRRYDVSTRRSPIRHYDWSEIP